MTPPPPVDAHGTRVQSMFNRIAPGYDRANRWMSLGIDHAWRERAVEGLMPDMPPPQPKVLDLCAGTMDGAMEIHRRFPAADIVAGDFAQEMLDRGMFKLVGSAAEKITPQTMDAHELPFANQSLDAIFCAFGIRNVSDLPRATEEQARCLRPGGVLMILEFFRPTTWLPKLLHTVYNRTVLPAVGWTATGDLDAYLYLPRSIGKFDRIEDYRTLLARHGFERITVHPQTLGMAWIVRAVRANTDA